MYSLLAFFIIRIIQPDYRVHGWRYVWFPCLLLLIQDCFLLGRFGLISLYLLACMVLSSWFTEMLLHVRPIAIPLCIGLFLGVYDVGMRYALFLHNFSIEQTTLKFFVNIGVAYMILLGTWGNRFLWEFFRKKRKVWTPNRKGAL